ncbi:sodium/potassium-transporting ATPase subunit beta-1-interacting protein 3-like [Styela clava]|uniref:sodium/potassium-transporting ATPase subunit beta-1-interacting protein 3-like n=1 Tax=Styela clava TaxID=7725 RepID=UPI001939B83A|nr:sodium/potassium-transporting ATPase subunit beta-1-interacting protein 3-like [Styela clava]
MGCSCNSRCIFVSICIIQLVTVTFRQVFDFLGLQWTSIVANFCQISVLILGLYGAYQYKRRIIAVYATWTLIWIGWNIFLICLYLDIGILRLNNHGIAVNLAITDSYSWFKNTSFSCDSLSSTPLWLDPTTPTNMPIDCAIDYRYIEIFQSGLQVAFACFGFIISCYVIGVLEDDSGSFDFIGSDDRKRGGPEESPLVRSHRVAEE